MNKETRKVFAPCSTAGSALAPRAPVDPGETCLDAYVPNGRVTESTTCDNGNSGRRSSGHRVRCCHDRRTRAASISRISTRVTSASAGCRPVAAATDWRPDSTDSRPGFGIACWISSSRATIAATSRYSRDKAPAHECQGDAELNSRTLTSRRNAIPRPNGQRRSCERFRA